MSDKNFNHLWHDALSQHASAVRHANGAASATKLFRKAAYRFAAVMIEITEKHHNEFLTMCNSSGVDIQAWKDKHFEVIEQMGDDRRNLIRAIKDGMTEKDYLAQGSLWSVRRRVAETRKVAQADTESTPKLDAMTDAERATFQRKQADAFRSECIQLRRDNALLVREVDQQKKVIARIERSVQSLRKKSA